MRHGEREGLGQLGHRLEQAVLRGLLGACSEVNDFP